MFIKKRKMTKTGTKNLVVIEQSLNRIETLTDMFKKKRISTENYIKEMHEALSKLTSERDYIEYLSLIGQK